MNAAEFASKYVQTYYAHEGLFHVLTDGLLLADGRRIHTAAGIDPEAALIIIAALNNIVLFTQDEDVPELD